jgi:hypothetical protein
MEQCHTHEGRREQHELERYSEDHQSVRRHLGPLPLIASRAVSEMGALGKRRPAEDGEHCKEAD